MALSIASSPPPEFNSNARTFAQIGITFDSAPASDEVVVLCLSLTPGDTAADPATRSLTYPSGFSVLVEEELTSPSGAACVARILWGMGDGSTTTYTITGFGTNSANEFANKVLTGFVVEGFVNTPTADTTNGNTTNSATSTIDAGSVTPTGDDSVVIGCVAFNREDGDPETVSVDGSFTIQASDAQTGAGADCWGGSATKILTSAAATSFTWTAGGTQPRSAIASIGVIKDASSGVDITPPAGSITLTGQTPSVAMQLRITPDAGAIALTGQQPTVAEALAREPGAGEITLTGGLPDVAMQLRIVPDAGAITLGSTAPSVDITSGEFISPDAGAITLTGAQPGVTMQLRITPAAGAITLQGYAPSLGDEDEVAPRRGGGGAGVRHEGLPREQ